MIASILKYRIKASTVVEGFILFIKMMDAFEHGNFIFRYAWQEVLVTGLNTEVMPCPVVSVVKLKHRRNRKNNTFGDHMNRPGNTYHR